MISSCELIAHQDENLLEKMEICTVVLNLIAPPCLYFTIFFLSST